MFLSGNERTDLALERATMATSRVGQQIPGVEVNEEELEGMKITGVSVLTPQAGAQIGKPPGRYFTLECPALRYRSREALKYVAGIIAS